MWCLAAQLSYAEPLHNVSILLTADSANNLYCKRSHTMCVLIAWSSSRQPTASFTDVLQPSALSAIWLC